MGLELQEDNSYRARLTMNALSNTRMLGNARFKIRAGPAGVHFFDRSKGINILVDEIKPPPNVWSAAPRQVSVALTNACDLACPHCYAPKSPATLAFQQIASWLVELDANGCLGVGFGGGEPTLYPRLTELCSFAMRETRLAVTMTTHAHRMDDQMLNELKGNLNFVRVSMDGIGRTYESIRGRSFDTLIDRIKSLSRIVPFGINFVANSRTIGDIESAARLAEKLGASEFLLLPEEPVSGRGGIDPKSTRVLCEWVGRYQGSVPLSVSQAGSDGLPTCDPLSSETGLAAFAHIDASGLLKRTSFDSTGIRIGEDGVLAALRLMKPVNQGADI